MLLDASLIGENAYFITQREEEFKNTLILEILRTICGLCDLVIEAMAVGLYETSNETVISQSPSFIKYIVDGLGKKGILVTVYKLFM